MLASVSSLPRIEPGLPFGDAGLRFAGHVPRIGISSPSTAVEALLRSSQSAYGPRDRYNYHNYDGHIESVNEMGQKIAKRCRRYGIRVEGTVLAGAIPSHDTFLALPPQSIGATSPEEVSAWVSYWILKRNGAPEAFARKVERTILGTHESVAIENEDTHAKILRAADLANLGSVEYQNFWRNTQRLHAEMENKTGLEIDYRSFVRGSLEYLGGYIAPYIKLTPEAVDGAGRSIFHTRSIINCKRLFEESRGIEDRKTKFIVEIGIDSDTPTMLLNRLPQPHIFYAGIAEPGSSVKTLRQYRASKPAGKDSGPTFFIPGNSNAVPIPNDSCDTVYIHLKEGTRDLNEAFRILRKDPGAKLYAIDKNGQRFQINPYLDLISEAIGDTIS